MINKVVYSENRRRMLSECPRQYFYDVYASWGGWWYKNKPPKSRSAESAYWDKHAHDVSRLAGTIVHEALAWALKRAIAGESPDRLELRASVMERGRLAAARAVEAARLRLGADPKKSARLVEVNNGLKLDHDEVRDRVMDSLMAATSDDASWRPHGVNLFMRAVERPTIIVSVDEMVEFEVSGLPVFAACDLMVKAKDSRSIVVLDWKTGEPSADHSSQLALYASWAAHRGWDSVVLMGVYLGQSGLVDVESFTMSSSEAKSRAAEMVESFSTDLSKRLVGGDLTANAPIESQFEPKPSERSCLRCRFFNRCGTDGTRPKFDGR